MPRLNDLKAAATRAARAEETAAERRARRDRLALEVYETNASVTYDDLASALGVTRDRISQVLREQREARDRLNA